MTNPIGIDFGGSGIKAAPVDLAAGDFAAERERIPTPARSTPEAVAEVMIELVAHFPDATGPVGVAIPGVVRSGVVRSAANIDKG
jgi:polyphosphate glucokinase